MGGRYPPRAVFKIPAIGVVLGILLTLAAMGSYHAAGSPVFCLSCHSMQDVGLTWRQSGHKQFACIECHLPDGNVAVQAAYKAKVGMRDLYHESLRDYTAFIKISEEGAGIASGNCLRCHYSTVQGTFMAAEAGTCLACHEGLVHGLEGRIGGIHVE